MRGFGGVYIVILVTLLVTAGFIVRQVNIKNNQHSVNEQIIIKESTQAAIFNPASAKPIQSSNPTFKPTPSTTPTPTPNPCLMGPPSVVTVDQSVHLTSVSPTSGKTGDTIILKGSGFGKSSFYFSDPTKFLGMVSFYGRPCGYNSGGAPPAEQGAGWWNDDTIKVRVPGVSPGDFQLEVSSSDGKRSNRLDFQVTK